MKKVILIPLLTLLLYGADTQEKISYTTKIGKIEFNISTKEVYTEFSLQNASKLEIFANEKISKIDSTSATIEIENNAAKKFAGRKRQLKTQIPSVTKIEPVLIYKDGIKQIATGEINLKIKKGYNISEVIKGYSFNIKPVLFNTNIFTLSSKKISTEELFSFITKLQQDKRVKFAEPNFIREIKPFTNDPFFNSQWAIKNQGFLGGHQGQA